MKFTSDVSLPKDDKTNMLGGQITARKLIGLRTHRNANYATRELEVQLYERYAKISRVKSNCIYSLIIHLEISILNILLVLSCEPHPKCKPKATDNCINKLCVSYTILAPASTSDDTDIVLLVGYPKWKV